MVYSLPSADIKPVADADANAVQPMPAAGQSPKTDTACRCLFGRPSAEVAKQIENLAKEAMIIEQQRFKRKWNFDEDVAHDWQDDAVVDNNNNGENDDNDDNDDQDKGDEPETAEVDEVSDVKLNTPHKQPQVGVNLALMATNFSWYRADNEKIPYFYYKPYGSASDPFRPLTCRRDGKSVPGTPHKRRHEETVETQPCQQTPKSEENSTVASPARLPAARRLNFNFGKPASVAPPTHHKITPEDVRLALEATKRNRTVSSSSSTSTLSSLSASTASSLSKSPRAATKKTPGKDRTKNKPTKNVEESPKSQVLITGWS